MRVSLFELLSFMVPIAFLCLWIANYQRTGIEWQEFTLEKMVERQKDETPILVLCVPEMFWDMPPQFGGELDSELFDEFEMSQIVTYRYEYRYWTGEWTPETKWIVEHGAGKEPSLILISRDGNTKRIRGFQFRPEPIIDFLEIDRIDYGRNTILANLLLVSLISTIAIIAWKRIGKHVG